MEPHVTITAWRDETLTLRDRIDSFPTSKHPALRPLLARLSDLVQYGLAHEFITPEGAERL